MGISCKGKELFIQGEYSVGMIRQAITGKARKPQPVLVPPGRRYFAPAAHGGCSTCSIS